MATCREIPADRAPDRARIEEAVTALERGALVALPTETVYGLAARADRGAAVERLREAKGRGTDQPFTWHAADVGTVLETFPALGSVVGRLADRYWPGPLTLVLAGSAEGLQAASREGWTGVRVPAHAGTRAVLGAAGFPVVMSSANRTGEPPMSHAKAVGEAFGGEVELVLDGGPARLGESSTVLAVGPGRFEVLRPGLLDGADLRRTAGLSLLFVCTGNTCRSPMAEGLARTGLARRLEVEDPGRFGFSVASAGLLAGQGSPASGRAVDVLAARSIELGDHRSRSLVPEEAARVDRVYCLTAGHRQTVVAMLPPGRAGHVELLDPQGGDVPDPIGGDRQRYEDCARLIETAIDGRLEEWA